MIAKFQSILKFMFLNNPDFQMNDIFFILEYYEREIKTVCNHESHVIRSQSECTTALHSLGYRSLSTYWTGTYNGIPSGCSISYIGDKSPHFETSSTGLGKRSSYLIPICKRNVNSGILQNLNFKSQTSKNQSFGYV